MNKTYTGTIICFLIISLSFIACKNNEVTDIILNTSNKDLIIGDTLKLATIIKAPENESYITKWSSSDEKIATVNDNGLVTARSWGDVSIIAQAGKKSATCQISVFNYIFTEAFIYNNSESSGINSNIQLSLVYNKPATAESNKMNDIPTPSTLMMFDLVLPEESESLTTGKYNKTDNEQNPGFLLGKMKSSTTVDAVSGSFILNDYIHYNLITDGYFNVLKTFDSYFIMGEINTTEERTIRFQYQGSVKERKAD